MENSLRDENEHYSTAPSQLSTVDTLSEVASADGISRFIEQMGLAAQGDGVPRIAGRLFGYFIVHGGPISFADLAEKLQVSRASVSTNARTLASLGIIERVTRPGDRQDYYQLAEFPFLRMIESYIARMRKMQEILQQADQSIPLDMAATHRRLAQMSDFYQVAVQNNEQMLKELQA
jgi:DNA-binding transcriptional regulator GbsR (MarR family)